MRNDLYQIIGRLMKDQFHLRDYAAFAVPKLFALAPVAGLVSEYLQELNIKEDISCLFAAAIKQYFHPFLYDRLSRIELDVVVNRIPSATYNKYIAAYNADFNKPFNNAVEGESDITIGRCFKLDGDFKADATNMILNSIFDVVADKAYRCQHQEAVESYFKFLRNRIEKSFSGMHKIASKACKQPKQPLGKINKNKG